VRPRGISRARNLHNFIIEGSCCTAVAAVDRSLRQIKNASFCLAHLNYAECRLLLR
jgi:hypothetical protein